MDSEAKRVAHHRLDRELHNWIASLLNVKRQTLRLHPETVTPLLFEEVKKSFLDLLETEIDIAGAVLEYLHSESKSGR
jgi:hypothetical protein